LLKNPFRDEWAVSEFELSNSRNQPEKLRDVESFRMEELVQLNRERLSFWTGRRNAK
jgi:hypothetical protein